MQQPGQEVFGELRRATGGPGIQPGHQMQRPAGGELGGGAGLGAFLGQGGLARRLAGLVPRRKGQAQAEAQQQQAVGAGLAEDFAEPGAVEVQRGGPVEAQRQLGRGVGGQGVGQGIGGGEAAQAMLGRGLGFQHQGGGSPILGGGPGQQPGAVLRRQGLGMRQGRHPGRGQGGAEDAGQGRQLLDGRGPYIKI